MAKMIEKVDGYGPKMVEKANGYDHPDDQPVLCRCGKCKHGGDHFVIKPPGTHLHCEHPKEQENYDPWDALHEWWEEGCRGFEPKP